MSYNTWIMKIICMGSQEHLLQKIMIQENLLQEFLIQDNLLQELLLHEHLLQEQYFSSSKLFLKISDLPQ